MTNQFIIKKKLLLWVLVLIIPIDFLTFERAHHFRNQLDSTCEGIDVVFTWVNGSEPSHRTVIQNFAGVDLNDREVKRRFNEYGVLRFALRSIHQYMPFARRTFLVTNGQIPVWWNFNNLKAQIVSHQQVFQTVKNGHVVSSSDALPTFNSNAIEINLHNIPGLGQYFVYFNDDMRLTKPVTTRDFVDTSTGKLQLGLTSRKSPVKNPSVWDKSVTATNIKLNERYHPNDIDWPHKYPQHVCYVFSKAIFKKAAEQWKDWFAEASKHRYRNTTDPVVPFLLTNMALEEGLGVEGHTINGITVDWQNNHKENQKAWNKLIKHTGKSVCIQDKFTNNPPTEHVIDDLERKLCTLFPDRSPYEDPGAPNPCDKH